MSRFNCTATIHSDELKPMQVNLNRCSMQGDADITLHLPAPHLPALSHELHVEASSVAAGGRLGGQ